VRGRLPAVPDVDPEAPVAPGPLLPLVLLVAVGGVLGSLARWALTEAFPGLGTTLGINVVGSFALGLLVGLRPHGRLSRPFLGTGVLGGFTTFSALAVQTVDASRGTAVAYLAGTLVLGTAAAALGLRVAR
jgi:CrcB protein